MGALAGRRHKPRLCPSKVPILSEQEDLLWRRNMGVDWRRPSLKQAESQTVPMIDRRGDQGSWLLSPPPPFSANTWKSELVFWPPVPKIMAPKCQWKNQVNNHLLNYQNIIRTPCQGDSRLAAGVVVDQPTGSAQGTPSPVLRPQGQGRHNPVFSLVTVLTTVECAVVTMIKLSSQNHSDRQCPPSSVPAEKSNSEKRIDS